jgi:hypothetical protein
MKTVAPIAAVHGCGSVFIPSIQIEARGRGRTFAVNRATTILHAVADKAAAEFQNILDFRGREATSELIPMAQLHLARAPAMQSDSVKARTAYQDFLAMWKDADPDIPILIAAKAEYAKLK